MLKILKTLSKPKNEEDSIVIKEFPTLRSLGILRQHFSYVGEKIEAWIDKTKWHEPLKIVKWLRLSLLIRRLWRIWRVQLDDWRKYWDLRKEDVFIVQYSVLNVGSRKDHCQRDLKSNLAIGLWSELGAYLLLHM